MSSLNKVQLIGRLGKDAELRHTDDGKAIASMNIATSETWRDKTSGEKKERTNWHRVVIFNDGLAKVAGQYCKKGGQVYVEGSIESREYTDKEGAKKHITEVVLRQYRGELVLLGRAGEGGQGAPAPTSADDYGQTHDAPSQPSGAAPAAGGGKPLALDLDDEVPF